MVPRTRARPVQAGGPEFKCKKLGVVSHPPEMGELCRDLWGFVITNPIQKTKCSRPYETLCLGLHTCL